MLCFKIPDYLLSEIYRRSNGFFVSKHVRDQNGRLVAFCKFNPDELDWSALRTVQDSWFRVLVKMVCKTNMWSYKWHEMTFCTRWDADHISVLCIGTDHAFERLLQGSLDRMWKELPPTSPWSLHVLLLEVIMALHDQAVWSIRDVVRDVEKVRWIWTLQVYWRRHNSA